MKIKFKVVAIYYFENKAKKTPFIKLELIQSKDIESEGYLINRKKVAYHNITKTNLIIGSDFIFNSEIYEIIKKSNILENGFINLQYIIKNKSIMNDNISE